ncbi:hypothetical protein LRU_01599 [Ligilactobacillus ruminis SPM0211]|uniref:Uncharacterized protein n=1 Tax=Ligilactobacillus ruminis SPM0211 TaxID=1040964 RepID=F7R1M5_9LACO|nr:hypothetical protein LRU_01599 [Ligilactobacillus ruminis SPM0211]
MPIEQAIPSSAFYGLYSSCSSNFYPKSLTIIFLMVR